MYSAMQYSTVYCCTLYVPAVLASVAVDPRNETHLVLQTRSVVDLLLNAATKEALQTPSQQHTSTPNCTVMTSHSGLRVRGLSPPPQLLAKPPLLRGKCGGRLKEGIRKRGKR